MRAFGELCTSLLSIIWKRLARGNGDVHAWQLATYTDELSTDELNRDELSADKLSSDELSTDKLSTDELSTDKLSTNHGSCSQFLRKLSAVHDVEI